MIVTEGQGAPSPGQQLTKVATDPRMFVLYAGIAYMFWKLLR